MRVLDLMNKTVRTCQVYPPGHELSTNFLKQLHKELGTYLEREGKLECRIEELSVYSASGQKVFEGRREDLFPWALYRSGIRGLAFFQGLSYDELKGFVDLMVNHPEDLLYYLLEADMAHIAFEVAEYVVLDGEVEVPEGHWRLSKEPLELEGGTPPSFSRDLGDVALTEEDVAYLIRELKAERGKDYLSSYLDIILQVFPMEGYGDVAQDFIKSVGSFALESLGGGDIHICLRVTKKMKELLEKGDLSPERASQLEEVLEVLRSPRTLRLMRKGYLSTWGDSFEELLFQLDPPRVDELLDWLEGEEREKVRGVLLKFLREKVKSQPSHLLSFFAEGGPRVKREMVRLAGELGEPEEGRRVLHMALDLDVEEVKKEALKVVLKMDPSSLKQLAERFLDSEDSEIRYILFDAMLELGGMPSVAPLLYREVTKEDFIDRTYLEKRLLFSALMLSNRVLFIEALKVVLTAPPGWRGRRRWEETLGVAFTVAMDTGGVAFRELRGLLEASGNKRAMRVWERLLRAREGAR